MINPYFGALIGGGRMKRYYIQLMVIVIIPFIVACSNTDKANTNEEQMGYFLVENGEKIFFRDAGFVKDVPGFDSILRSTVKSLNEIKDGKRDLHFITEIQSEELEQDEEYKAFLDLIPEKSEVRTIRADIENYKITGLRYDKDQNLIKVFIKVVTKEKQKDGSVNVLNNQTYIYKIINNKLLLTKYDLSQHLQ